VGINSRGVPITPVLTWADSRSAAYSQKLRSEFDDDEILQSTGTHLHSSFWPAKILWAKDAFGIKALDQVKWLGLPDLLMLRMTGRTLSQASLASATGLLDFRNGRWFTPLLDKIGLTENQLPEITESHKAIRLKESLRRRFVKLKNSLWLPSISDGAANTVALSRPDSGKLILMIGTSAALRVLLSKPPKRIPEGLFYYRIDNGCGILGGAISDGGSLIDWLRNTLRLDKSNRKLSESFFAAARNPSQIEFRLGLNGERSPLYRELVTASILNLTADCSPYDIALAAIKSLAESAAEIAARIEHAYDFKTVIACGKPLSRFPFLRSIIEESLARDIILAKDREWSLTGAAQYALFQINQQSDY
ncbi:MAG TPA: FGGY family carbohydrate kinase, partial [Pyrinomonadaceae bacterium]|nr:FGGY family carbohydrate kinase [Pyrinomonadaceae bacterium]